LPTAMSPDLQRADRPRQYYQPQDARDPL
jgi:hypothetical protein